jgi:hypothetical protein
MLPQMFPGRIWFFKALGDPLVINRREPMAVSPARTPDWRRTSSLTDLEEGASGREPVHFVSERGSPFTVKRLCQDEAGLAVLRHATGYALANKGVDEH